MKLLFLVTCGCFVLSGCGPVTPEATEADVATAVFGSTENLNAIKAATKVTACRIKEPPEDAQRGASWEQVLALYEEGEWIDVRAAQADRLQQVLSAPRTYEFGFGKSCLPRYGVRLRFEDENQAFDVNLCFECEVLAVTKNDQAVGVGLFDGGAHKLAAICKELFPDDAEIQALNP
jgi:hypothetical protein